MTECSHDSSVDLGAGIFALHDPHPGHERDFNRYYERDHMYAAAILAPWTIAGTRFVATADLKRCAIPADGPFGPIQEGSYLTMYWIVAGKLDEQQALGQRADEAAQRRRPHVRPTLGADGDQLRLPRLLASATPTACRRSWRSIAVTPAWCGLVVERTGDGRVAELAQWLADDFPTGALCVVAGRAGRPCSRPGPKSRGGRPPRPRYPVWASGSSSRSSSKTTSATSGTTLRRPRRTSWRPRVAAAR